MFQLSVVSTTVGAPVATALVSGEYVIEYVSVTAAKFNRNETSFHINDQVSVVVMSFSISDASFHLMPQGSLSDKSSSAFVCATVEASANVMFQNSVAGNVCEVTIAANSVPN